MFSWPVARVGRAVRTTWRGGSYAGESGKGAAERGGSTQTSRSAPAPSKHAQGLFLPNNCSEMPQIVWASGARSGVTGRHRPMLRIRAMLGTPIGIWVLGKDDMSPGVRTRGRIFAN